MLISGFYTNSWLLHDHGKVISFVIQLTKALVRRVYTPYLPALPQPSPQEITPIRTWRWSSGVEGGGRSTESGPPESPWQASPILASLFPAQNMLAVTTYDAWDLLHVCWSTIGTTASCSFRTGCLYSFLAPHPDITPCVPGWKRWSESVGGRQMGLM